MKTEKIAAKHTPGPWTVGPVDGGTGIFHDVDGPQDTFIGTINSDSDARLIAAAPDLLLCLKRVVHDLNSYHEAHGQGSVAACCDNLVAARAAIQKAEAGR